MFDQMYMLCLYFDVRLVRQLPKARREMNGHVPMSLFKTIIFFNIVKIISTNYNGSLHFHLNYNSSQYSSSYSHITSKGTFFINISSFLSLSKCDIFTSLSLLTCYNDNNLPLWEF